MRADRLLSLVLLLQARGRATAQAIAAELEVSVRTVYRDLEALAAAGVPVLAESGRAAGAASWLATGSRCAGCGPTRPRPCSSWGCPVSCASSGWTGHWTRRSARSGSRRAADRRSCTLTCRGGSAARRTSPACGTWPGRSVPAGGWRSGTAPRDDAGDAEPRVVGPLGLVNKAGLWYLVASPAGAAHDRPGVRVFRVARIASARVLAEPFERPAGFELAGFWREWSAEFEASRPRLPVTLRASPRALAAFGEIFGQAAGPALAAALPPDEDGWRVVTLSFEHERAAAHRLAGFGDQVEVLTPPSVRAGLVATARQLLRRYDAADALIGEGSEQANRVPVVRRSSS